MDHRSPCGVMGNADKTADTQSKNQPAYRYLGFLAALLIWCLCCFTSESGMAAAKTAFANHAILNGNVQIPKGPQALLGIITDG